MHNQIPKKSFEINLLNLLKCSLFYRANEKEIFGSAIISALCGDIKISNVCNIQYIVCALIFFVKPGVF